MQIRLALCMAMILLLAGCSGVLQTVTSPVHEAPLALDDTFRLPQAPPTGRITLAWDDPHNASQVVGGYYLYYWQSNGDTPKRVDVGKRTTYTLEGLEVGQPYTFAVTAHDAQGGRESVWSNQVHRQIETSSFTVEAPGVLANDHTQDGNALTAELVSGASHGTVDLRQDGSFIYTPHNGFHGNDSFTYRAIRGAMASVPATVTLHVTSINGEPRAAVSFIHTTAVSSQR